MKILWIRLSSLGDVVHTLPAITELNDMGFSVDVLTESSFIEIFRLHRGVDKIIPAHIRQNKKNPIKLFNEFIKLRQQIKNEKYDVVIDAQGLYKSAFLAFNTAKIVIGGNRYSVRERGVSSLYKQTVEIDLSANVLKRYRQLAINSAKIFVIPEQIIDGILLESPSNFNLQNKFVINKNSAPKKIWLFHGISQFRKIKQWDFEQWQMLTKLLKANNYEVYTLWQSPNEKIFAQHLAQSGAIIVPPMELPQLINLFSDNSQISAAVCLDSGLGHLANAIGLPTVMLFAPTSARRFNSTHLEFQKYLSAEFECAPCGLRTCQKQTKKEQELALTPPCWQSISAHTVFEKITEIC